MKHKFARYSFRLLGLFLVLVCALSTQAQILEETFSDTWSAFKISSPNQHWNFVPRGTDPGLVRSTLRYESPINQFVPNVTVQVEELLDPKIKVETLLKNSLKNLPERIEVIEQKKIEHKNKSGYEVLLHDQQSDVVFQQWIFIANGKNFVLTCSSHRESYTRMREDFQKILTSFEFI